MPSVGILTQERPSSTVHEASPKLAQSSPVTESTHSISVIFPPGQKADFPSLVILSLSPLVSMGEFLLIQSDHPEEHPLTWLGVEPAYGVGILLVTVVGTLVVTSKNK
jgi:hypothetical protein